MVNKLGIADGDLILEPCAGDGIFIEKIISVKESGYEIEALDLNPIAIKGLKTKFGSHKNIKIRQADTLLDSGLDLFANFNGNYSKIIGNPPYGAWQEYEKRDLLKKVYGGYVKETYTLFIKKCIDLLKENGRLVFIVPDTFLALHLHKDTRKKILNETKLEEILLIPSKFFPGVNFGYSNLCIITLEKNRVNEDNAIKIISVQDDVNKLYKLAKGTPVEVDYSEVIKQGEVKAAIDLSFFIGGNEKIRRLINETDLKLGDIADCVTGFYSGDNKQFLAPISYEIKGTKKYALINEREIDYDYLKQEDVITGLKKEKKYIPILKGGNGMFSKGTEWFVKWDIETVNFYHKDKKARFQNSQYYFRDGIGVPMVKSSKLHAFLIERRLFDQSIVGIFPKDSKHLYYLLAFLNSDVCNKIMHVINHTANNSANYLKKLPIILDEKAIRQISEIMKKYLVDEDKETAINKINSVFNSLYNI
jgi:hypothetical protein